MYAERLAPLSGKLTSSDARAALASAWSALAGLHPDVAAATPVLAELDSMLSTSVSFDLGTTLMFLNMFHGLLTLFCQVLLSSFVRGHCARFASRDCLGLMLDSLSF